MNDVILLLPICAIMERTGTNLFFLFHAAEPFSDKVFINQRNFFFLLIHCHIHKSPILCQFNPNPCMHSMTLQSILKFYAIFSCSIVSITTSYRLDSPGIESRWEETSWTRPDRPWDLPSLLYNGCRVISGGKVARVWL
jgi:hypothetical protein